MPTESTAQRLLPHLRRVVLARDAETGDGQLLGAFIASRDEAAFAALVRRHGPMVLGVCRRVVGDPHLAEDAFQATFLVLARRAAAVRPRHLVGHWLYGVAYRTALKARGSAARRRAKEKQVDAMPQRPVSPDEVWADLQPVLDAELARLPEKYRVPIVLCDLNGRPQRDVARELRLPPATLANRLSAARRLLARRLSARGLALSAGAVAAALGWHAATSAVPPALAAATVRAACAVAAGAAVGLPVPVVQLSEGVMRMFVLAKLKTVAAGVATGLILLAGLGLVAGPSLRANPDDKPVPTPDPKSAAKPAGPHRPPDVDDLEFLRRRSLDLRGTLPSGLEARYFLADKDERKRDKVTGWMLEEHGQQKATAACQSCHDAGPWTIEIRGILGDRTDTATGAPVGDDARKRWLELFQTKDPNVESYHRHVKRVLERTDEAHAKADVATLAVEEARAEVAKAQADLDLAQARPKAGRVDEHQAEVGRARVTLFAATARLQAAEAQLAERQKSLHRSAQPPGSKKTDSSTDRIIEQLDLLLVEGRVTLLDKSEVTDLEFLRRVSLDVRGTPPTKVEEHYFLADKDPGKREKLLGQLIGKAPAATGREKLLDDLLTDPEVQKRWTVLWKERIERERQRAALEVWVTRSPGDRLTRLLGELLGGKRADDQVLDALYLATMARFPTATERKLILDSLKAQSDRQAAWQVVLKALAATSEAKQHAEELAKRASK